MASNRTTREVFEAHLHLRQDGNVERDIAENYAPDVVMLTGDGTFHGHAGVRETSHRLHDRLGNARYSYRTMLHDGEMAFLEWGAADDLVSVEDGADSFLIRDGKIRVQTIHYTVYPAKQGEAWAWARAGTPE